MLAWLYCAMAIHVQVSWPIFCDYTFKFQALPGQSPAIVASGLEMLCNWSQESVSCRFEKGERIFSLNTF